jgi:hypothetical protein
MPVETVTLSFRAERDLVDRLGAVLEEMKREVPGARLKLSEEAPIEALRAPRPRAGGGPEPTKKTEPVRYSSPRAGGPRGERTRTAVGGEVAP